MFFSKKKNKQIVKMDSSGDTVINKENAGYFDSYEDLEVNKNIQLKMFNYLNSF